MVTLYLGLIGLLVFLVGVGISGLRLRGHPSTANAEKISRATQFLFFAGLGPPFLVALFYPGLAHLDELVGIPPLPARPIFLGAGILLAIPGLYLLVISNKSLRALGSGANAFRLTVRIVEKDIYHSTRNPMSLGYYLGALSIGFLSGSSILTLYVLCGIIPAHVFYLKFFEERELALRFGEAYLSYKQKVPFLFPKISAG
jgi:protein-S-isoprenylcysteine O-methyltransferase Ste14